MPFSLEKIEHTFHCQMEESAFVSKGKNEYCNSCQREIHDLTEYTYSEIWHLLDEKKGEVCAKFYPDQLVRNESHGSNSGLGLVAAGLATLLSIAASNNVKAQSRLVSTEIHAEVKKTDGIESESHDDVRSLSKKVEVEVFSDSEKPVTELRRRLWFRLGRMRVYKQNKFPFVKVRIRIGSRRGKVMVVRTFRGLSKNKRKRSEE